MRSFSLHKNKQSKGAPQAEPPVWGLHDPKPTLHGLQPGPCKTMEQRKNPPKGCQALPFPLCGRKGTSPHSRHRARGQGRAFATFNNRHFLYGVQAETLCRLTEPPFPASGMYGCFDPLQPLLSAGGCGPCRVPGKGERSLRTPTLLEYCSTTLSREQDMEKAHGLMRGGGAWSLCPRAMEQQRSSSWEKHKESHFPGGESEIRGGGAPPRTVWEYLWLLMGPMVCSKWMWLYWTAAWGPVCRCAKEMMEEMHLHVNDCCVTDGVESMNMDPTRNSEGPCCVKLSESCGKPMHITHQRMASPWVPIWHKRTWRPQGWTHLNMKNWGMWTNP